MSIYCCFAFDYGSEFARLQTVKEQSAIVDTFSIYVVPPIRFCSSLLFPGKDGAKIKKDFGLNKKKEKKWRCRELQKMTKK